MTEMGLGGGVQCRSFRGYHLREADLLFEIVDPASGLAALAQKKVPEPAYVELPPGFCATCAQGK